MAKRGDVYPAEEITLVDSSTGAEYVQMTNAPVHSVNLYFEYQSFTPDDRTLLFLSQRVAMRGAPYDLFAADIESKQLRQLSDDEHPFSSPCSVPDEPRMLYGVRGTSIVRMSVDDASDEEVARWEGGRALGVGMMSGDGRVYVAVGTRADGTSTLVRFDLHTGDVRTFLDGIPSHHLTVNHSGTLVTFTGTLDGETGPVICDIDGGNARFLSFRGFAHGTFYGTTDLFQGTLLPPGHGVVIWDPNGDQPPEKVAAGPYFWHSGSSLDGRWIICDTNWPDEGLLLVDVESGRFGPVVIPSHRGHASGNPQESHPHPSFDRSGDRIVYASNETGLSQVYVATIPGGLRQELSTGNLTNRRRYRT